MPLLRCPVRSATHVSVLPVARATVTNVALKSWARIGWRTALRSKSWLLVTPARLKSRRSERSLRRIALGRKNYLFVGDVASGKSLVGL